MLIDTATLHIEAGTGGSGAASFRREKFIPKGGPDGGDGGDGGDVIIEVDPHMRTLLDFKRRPHVKAGRGQHGQGSNKTGASGEDAVVRVPPGTVVHDAETGEVLGDLTDPEDRLVAARGGRGGRGNARFASSTNQAPRTWEPGEAGEKRTLRLELKLIADLGLVGQPNAGKSTLLSRISAARPKIADYPFTTLEPNLGLVELGGHSGCVVADIPGLIEGASRGKGLGYEFLRHVERTSALLYLVDLFSDTPIEDLHVLQGELDAYSEALARRPAGLLLTKLDLIPPEDRPIHLELRGLPEGVLPSSRPGSDFVEVEGLPALAVSSHSGEGFPEVRQLMGGLLENTEG
ncbi:MAG: GTPase ObgE [bacterium]